MPRYRKVLTQEEINKVLFEDTDESDLDLSDEDGELDMSNTFQAADFFTLLESDSDSKDVEDCKYERQKINLTLVCLRPIAKLAELKTLTAQHIHNISMDTLRSVVERAISGFEFVAENGGQHIVAKFLLWVYGVNSPTRRIIENEGLFTNMQENT
ncbi:hypothetical protein AVEN_243948-1 [Araneus ventricosus]|uniref:Uncharacterized protein n=1 Tax=Araneus ventricosus TaxID=182803 RepID=A0A4Y2QM95_ARAVE|nr:hypothetical protein AVEN_243948-1 [Araneus ventricosus]